MLPKLSELIAALPDDVEAREDSDRPEFEELFGRVTQRPVPTGSLRRLWALGGLQARITLAYLAYWLRTYFKDANEKERDRLETHLRAATRLLSTMGYLRGAVMKIGQFLGSLPEVIPEEFVETLSRLHFEAPPMHYTLLREHVRNELGGDPEEIFDSFETQAFAAASLGQVHRARLKSGETVAVKIQYPGIASTISSDWRNLVALLSPLRLTKDWENLKQQADEIRQVLESETDYEREASSLRLARSLFRAEDGIVVPRVFDSHSTRRVLTMEYVDGKGFHDFLATNSSQELRNDFGDKIWRCTARLYHKAKAYYSDPHPGNFLFLKDGRLGFIDLGCVRTLSDAEWKLFQLGERAMRGGVDEAIAYLKVNCLMSDEEVRRKSAYVHDLIESCRWAWEPYVRDGRFDFGDVEYLRRGLRVFSRVARTGQLRQQPVLVFVNRALFANAGLLYRLGAQVKSKAISDEEAA